MSKKQSLRVQISFKEKVDELEIYNWIEENSKIIGVSAFIKSVLKEAMEREKINTPKSKGDKGAKTNKTDP